MPKHRQRVSIAAERTARLIHRFTVTAGEEGTDTHFFPSSTHYDTYVQRNESVGELADATAVAFVL